MSEQLKLDVEVKNKMSDKLIEQLGDWTCLYPFFEGPEWIRLKEQLKPDVAKISTPINKWFRAFKLCPYKDLKVVFLGLSPYHTTDIHTKEVVADGLAFSTATSHSVPPSLFRIYKGIEADLWDRMNLDMVRNNDLSFLAEQGILLGNVALTTILGTAAYHTKVWEPFTKFWLEVLNKEKEDLIFVGFGQVACDALQKIDRTKHLVIELEHPAYAAREMRDWKHENAFSKINTFLRDKDKEPIMWDNYLVNLGPAPF